jgi:hypothetical protein
MKEAAPPGSGAFGHEADVSSLDGYPDIHGIRALKIMSGAPLQPFRAVDEQHAGPALHDNGVALDELALVDQHTLRDLPEHWASFRLWFCNRLSRRY